MLQKNKFSRYFVYAIGEIFLVVIGILIALSINNWNDLRKIEAKELAILKEIRNDLESNAEALKNCYSYDSISILSYDIIIDHLEANKTYKDSLKYHFANLIEWCAYDIVESTYSNLKQTLGVNLISDESLRKRIVNLYEQDYPFTTQNIDKDESNVHNILMLPKFSKLFFVEEDTSSNDIKVAIPVDYQNLLNDNDFLTSVKIIRNKRNWSVTWDKRIYDNSLSAITNIDRFLNDK